MYCLGVKLRLIPRPCAVASQRVPVLVASRKRESPRRKAVASQRVVQLVASRERESPRRKAVASKFEHSSSVSLIAHPRNGPYNSVANRARTELTHLCRYTSTSVESVKLTLKYSRR